MTLSTPMTSVRCRARGGVRKWNATMPRAATASYVTADGLASCRRRRLTVAYSCVSGFGSCGTSGGRSLSRARSRGASSAGGGVVDGRQIGERFAAHQLLHLIGVEHFAREQRVGDVEQRLLVRRENLGGAAVGVHDEALHLGVDLERRVFAVVLVLRDLAAEEDLLFLLAEGERAHRVAHAPLAHHLARQIGGALEIVAGAGRDVAGGQLLGDAAAEQDGDGVVRDSCASSCASRRPAAAA